MHLILSVHVYGLIFNSMQYNGIVGHGLHELDRYSTIYIIYMVS